MNLPEHLPKFSNNQTYPTALVPPRYGALFGGASSILPIFFLLSDLT